MVLWVTLGSNTPGVQVGSGNPLTDLQLPAGRGGGRVNAAGVDAADVRGGGGAVVAWFAQPVVSEYIASSVTIVFDFMFAEYYTRGKMVH